MDFTSEKVLLKGFFIIGAVLLTALGMQSRADMSETWWEDTAPKSIGQEISQDALPYQFIEYGLSEMVPGLLEDTAGEFAGQLWNNQVSNRVYDWKTVPQLFPQRKTYYVSSSVGSDNNSGLSPDQPKKTLAQYSGLSDVNVMLKCGDSFDMKNSFHLGDNVILAAYGSGQRPILDYYQDMNVSWNRVTGYQNVWSADLSQIPGLNNGESNTSNYNIGHLRINGKQNWKRAQDGEHGPGFRQNAGDGSFGIDVGKGVIYLYDTGDPNLRKIEYALPRTAIVMSDIKNSMVMGLELTGAGFHGISMSDVAGVEIKNCYIHNIGGAYLNNTLTRFGNAVEIWDGGDGVEVAYNLAEWIYDACYTNQSRGESVIQRNIHFYRNIGRYSFWGIESWGNQESGEEFDNIVYEENILMYACDVTAPQSEIYVTGSGRNTDGEGVVTTDTLPYISYRGGYYFHQMSLIMTSTASPKISLTCKNNVCWETNRYLCITSKSEDAPGYSGFEGNFFYAELPTREIAVFRTEDTSGRHYRTAFPFEGNHSVLPLIGQGNSQPASQRVDPESRNLLEQALSRVANGGG